MHLNASLLVGFKLCLGRLDMLSGWLSSRVSSFEVGSFEGSFLFMTKCLLICKIVVCTCAVLLQFMVSVRTMFCNAVTYALCKPLFLPPGSTIPQPLWGRADPVASERRGAIVGAMPVYWPQAFLSDAEPLCCR